MSVRDEAATPAVHACGRIAAFPEPLAATIRAAMIAMLDTPIPDAAAETALPSAVQSLCNAVGSVGIGLDLLRVLRGEQPLVRTHLRPVIAATLRVKRRRLGRSPADGDWPALHVVSLFARAYWGGVQAWSAGAASRIQRPKHFWAHRGHQVAAIRRFRAEHPEQPITTGTLGSHGFATLARSLTAAELKALCDEAGCGRDLARRPNGWWTEARVINAYAALCHDAGITLSAHALVLTGGEASSLRVYARRHYGQFRAFQAAVRECHPDIRLPARPTANDGTPLDSWSEVVVYQALRRALPEVPIAPHVLLPGEGRRSTDLVLAGSVHLEVLGLSFKAIAAPRTKRQRKYARNWRQKQARYRALGIVPIVVTPEDVHDGARLADRVRQVAAVLDCTPAVLPLPETNQVRAKGTWSDAMLLESVGDVAGATGQFPTYAALAAAGYGHATNLLRRPGVRAWVRLALGLTDPHARQWTESRVVEGLAAWTREQGTYPTRDTLRRHGRGDLASARDRLWGGREAALRAAVASCAGQPVRPARAPNGSFDTLQKVAGALRPLAQALGRMPTLAECASSLLGTAWSVGSRRWGVAAVAAAIGTAHTGPKRRTDAEILALLATVPAPLTTTAVRRHLGFGGVAWVRRCGGIEAVRRAVGR